MTDGLYFNLFFPLDRSENLEPQAFVKQIAIALGKKAKINTESLRKEDNSYRFWLTFDFAAGNDSIEVDAPGGLVRSPSAWGCLYFYVDPRDAGWPLNDQGEFFEQIVLPLARQIECILVTAWEDDVGFTKGVIEALQNRSLPYRAKGYYLNREYVERIDLKNLRQAYQMAKRMRSAELKGAGLSDDATPRQIQESDDWIVSPKPRWIEYEDGSLAIYGLIGGDKYWRLLGLRPATLSDPLDDRRDQRLGKRRQKRPLQNR